MPILYSYNNDVSKKWYVGYRDKKGRRVKKYGNINRIKTLKERLKAAKELIKSIIAELNEKEYRKVLEEMKRQLELRKSTWRPKTYSSYSSKLLIFQTYIAPRGISQETIESFFLEFLTSQRKVQPMTYNAYIVSVGMFLEWIGERALIKNIKKRKTHPNPAGYFNDAQKKFLLKHLEDNDNLLYHFVQFIYYCFLRPNEIRLMKVGDIILQKQQIVVRGDIAKNNKQQYIAIPDAFMPLLSRFVQGRNPNGYIFYIKDIHTPMGVNTMASRHLKYLKELHFDTKRYKLYSWKHTGAVAAVEANIHIKQMQIQLRHSSLDQVDMYLRQLGAHNLQAFKNNFPKI